MGKGGPPRVGNLKLDLPVDEDDYLMPSPQSTQPHHGYMDLIGDAKLGGSNGGSAEGGELNSGDFHSRSNMPDFVKSLPAIKRMTGIHPTLPLSMDNPEYHMMAHQDVNTLYNPSSPSYQISSPTSSVSSGLPVGNGATLGIPVNSLGVGTNSTASSTTSSTASGAGAGPVQFPVGAFGPRYLTQRSSEEEGSDHDYYNDLQRELQPLQPLKRNETTV